VEIDPVLYQTSITKNDIVFDCVVKVKDDFTWFTISADPYEHGHNIEIYTLNVGPAIPLAPVEYQEHWEKEFHVKINWWLDLTNRKEAAF